MPGRPLKAASVLWFHHLQPLVSSHLDERGTASVSSNASYNERTSPDSAWQPRGATWLLSEQ